MITTDDSKTAFNALEEQFSHDGKEAARERLRERRDELLRDDPFARPYSIYSSGRTTD